MQVLQRDGEAGRIEDDAALIHRAVLLEQMKELTAEERRHHQLQRIAVLVGGDQPNVEHSVGRRARVACELHQQLALAIQVPQLLHALR